MTGPVMPEEPPLITLTDVVTLAGAKSLSVVSNWKKRKSNFPKPVKSAPSGDLYDQAQILEWLVNEGKLDPKSLGSAAQDSSTYDLFDRLDKVRYQRTGIELELALTCLMFLIEPDERATVAESGADLEDSLIKLARRCEERGLIARGALADVIEENSPLDQELTRRVLRNLADEYLFSGVFEGILMHAAERLGRYAAESQSTSELSEFFEWLIPSEVATVLDPAVGSGSLLLHSVMGIRRPPRIVAIDRNKSSWRTAAQLLTVNSFDADVRIGDSLLEEHLSPPESDLIVIDPPYGTKPDARTLAVWESRSGFPGTRPQTTDMIWLDYAIRHLSPRGIAFVVLPTGPLFRGGAEGAIRAEMLRRGVVQAIISLPPGLAPSTRIPLSIWVLRPESGQSMKPDVLLINASARDTGGTRAWPEQSRRLLDAAAEFKTWNSAPQDYQPKPGLSTTVPILELLAPGAPLTPSYWIDKTDVQEPKALGATALDSIREVAELLHASPSMTPDQLKPAASGSPHQALVSLQALADAGRILLTRGTRIDRGTLQDSGRHPVLTPTSLHTTASNIQAAGYLDALPQSSEPTRAGDVIFVPSGRIRAAVDSFGGHILAAPLIGIRPTANDPALSPHLLAALLSSSRISALAVGTTIPSVTPKQATIPAMPQELGEAVAKAFNALAQTQTYAAHLATSVGQAQEALAAAVAAGGLDQAEASEGPAQPARPIKFVPRPRLTARNEDSR